MPPAASLGFVDTPIAMGGKHSSGLGCGTAHQGVDGVGAGQDGSILLYSSSGTLQVRDDDTGSY